MSADEARSLHEAKPPAEPDPEIPVVRMLRLGRGIEWAVSRDYELDEEVSISGKDSSNHFVGGKQTMRVVEVSDRLYKREGHPQWIKRLFILRPV